MAHVCMCILTKDVLADGLVKSVMTHEQFGALYMHKPDESNDAWKADHEILHHHQFRLFSQVLAVPSFLWDSIASLVKLSGYFIGLLVACTHFFLFKQGEYWYKRLAVQIFSFLWIGKPWITALRSTSSISSLGCWIKEMAVHSKQYRFFGRNPWVLLPCNPWKTLV